MEINGLQIASVIFSVSMIYFSYFCYKKNYFGIAGFTVWTIVFLGLIVAALFPAIFSPFQSVFQVARLFDLFIVIGFFFIIIITFINFIHLQKLKKKIGHYIQKEALKNHSAEDDEEDDDDGEGETS